MSSGRSVYIDVSKKDNSPFDANDQTTLSQALEQYRNNAIYVNFEQERFRFTVLIVSPSLARIVLSKYYGSSDHSDDDSFSYIQKAVDHDLVLGGRIERELNAMFGRLYSFDTQEEYW